eukprot:gene60473-80654_t
MAHAFHPLSRLVCIAWLLALWLPASALQAKEPMSQQQALRTLNHSDPQQRFEAMNRLAVIGTADAADAVLPRLHDKEPALRNVALGTVWQMWGRTGDKEIDTLYGDGTAEMKEGNVLEAIRIFSDIITKPGLVTVDFADVRSVMADAGTALLGIGVGSGRSRASEAAQAAMSSPLLESARIDGAKGCVINISGGKDMTLEDMTTASEVIYDVVDPD